MDINIVILVVCFWGARALRDQIKELIVEHAPATENKTTKTVFWLLGLAAGWGVFLLYIYFAGYRIMAKEPNITLSWILALIPNVLAYGYKFFIAKAALIE